MCCCLASGELDVPFGVVAVPFGTFAGCVWGGGCVGVTAVGVTGGGWAGGCTAEGGVVPKSSVGSRGQEVTVTGFPCDAVIAIIF